MSDDPKESETPQDDRALPPDSGQGTSAGGEEESTAPQRAEEALVTPANDAYSSSSDPYGQIETIPPEAKSEEITGYMSPEAVAQIPPKPQPPPPPPAEEAEGEVEEEKGMLRVSFMEYVEALGAGVLCA